MKQRDIIGEVFNGKPWSLEGFGLILLLLILFTGLTYVVAYFSKWWDQTGYWIGFSFSYVIYLILRELPL